MIYQCDLVILKQVAGYYKHMCKAIIFLVTILCGHSSDAQLPPHWCSRSLHFKEGRAALHPWTCYNCHVLGPLSLPCQSAVQNNMKQMTSGIYSDYFTSLLSIS